MRLSSSYVTLAAGAALGAVLLVASTMATPTTPADGAAPGATATSSASPGSTGAGGNAAPVLPGCRTAVAAARPLSDMRQASAGTGGRPFAVAVTPDLAYSFVTRGDSVAVLSNRSGLAPTLLHTIAVPGASKGAAVTRDGRYLLVAAGSGAVVLSVDRAEHGGAAVLGTLTSPGGQGAVQVAVSPEGRFAYVTLQQSGGLAVFDLHRALAGSFASSLVGTVPTGKQPVGIGLSGDPGHQWLYLTSWGPPGTVSVLSRHLTETDPAHALLTRSPARAGCQPSRVVTSVDGRYVWVTAQGSNALLAFRATGLRASPGKALAAVVPVGDHPIGAVEVRAGRQIVVANSGGSRNLMVVDTRTALCQPGHRAVTGAIPAGRGPRELSPEGSKALLVTNLGAGQLEAVSLDGLPQPGPGGPPPGCGG